MSLDQIFNEMIEKEVKKFSQNKAKKKEFQMCEKVGNEIDRLSELLAMIRP